MVEFVNTANKVEVNFEKYKNIPKKRILEIEKMEGITEFSFNEDSYWGNSFSFTIKRESE